MFFKNKETRSIEQILTPKEKKVEIEKDETEMVEELEVSAEEVEIAEVPKAENFADNALKCFGWKEIKTEKWLVKCAKIWYGFMSFFWFLFGSFTFAPTIFISGKVNVIFKNKKKSLFAGTIIYGIIVSAIVCLIITRNA